MIIDRISNAHLYEHLSPRIKRAFDYLRRTDLASLSPGRHDIDGDRLYVMLSQYETKSKPQGTWEAHRRYIDLQVVIQGTEQIGYSHVGRLTPGAYATDRDFVPLAGDGDFLTLSRRRLHAALPRGRAHARDRRRGPAPGHESGFQGRSGMSRHIEPPAH